MAFFEIPSYQSWKQQASQLTPFLQECRLRMTEELCITANPDGSFQAVTAELADPAAPRLNWALSALPDNGIPDAIAVRYTYLCYLHALQQLSLSREQQQQIRRELELTTTSAPNISFRDLRVKILTSIAENMPNTRLVQSTFQDSSLFRYSILNAVAAILQNPFAKRLYTNQELSRMQIKIKPQQRPVYVYSPANLKEPHRHIIGRMFFLYDISQLDISREQAQILLNQPEQYQPQDYLTFAKNINNLSALACDFPSPSFTSQYDAVQQAVLYDPRRLSSPSLAMAAADALMHQASTRGELERNLESACLTMQLLADGGLPLPSQATAQLSESLRLLPQLAPEELEKIVSTAARAAQFMQTHLEEFAQQRIQQEQVLYRTPHAEPPKPNFFDQHPLDRS